MNKKYFVVYVSRKIGRDEWTWVNTVTDIHPIMFIDECLTKYGNEEDYCLVNYWPDDDFDANELENF